MESRDCIEALDRTLLGMRVVGGCTFCCEFPFLLLLVRIPRPFEPNSSLTGVCFLFFLVISYNMLKKRGSDGGEELTSGKTLLYAAEASQSCPVPPDSHEVVNAVFFRCCYRDTRKPRMGGEGPNVHNTSE